MDRGPDGDTVDGPPRVAKSTLDRWRTSTLERWGDSPRYRWLVLTVALIGLFSVGFSITVLAVSIPTIAADLGA